jgi:hypothetical protein
MRISHHRAVGRYRRQAETRENLGGPPKYTSAMRLCRMNSGQSRIERASSQ